MIAVPPLDRVLAGLGALRGQDRVAGARSANLLRNVRPLLLFLLLNLLNQSLLYLLRLEAHIQLGRIVCLRANDSKSDFRSSKSAMC